MTRYAAMLCLLLSASCDRSQQAEYPDLDTPIPPLAASSHEAGEKSVGALLETRPQATLYRDEVELAISEGLGRFLQHVELGASLEEGRFRGFRVLRLSPADFWSDVDLREGDVVLSVNGMPIERPKQAHEAFSSLASADRLVVTLLREGRERKLRFSIRDRPAAPGPEPKRTPKKSSKPPQSDS